MPSPPSLPVTHVGGQAILATEINDIAAGVNSSIQIGTTHVRSKLAIVYNPSGTFPLSPIPIWCPPIAITVQAIKAYRVGGTGATINVRRVVGTTATNMLSSDYSVTATAPPWSTAGSLVGGSNTLSAGNSLEVLFQSISGTPTLIAVQVDYTESLL